MYRSATNRSKRKRTAKLHCTVCNTARRVESASGYAASGIACERKVFPMKYKQCKLINIKVNIFAIALLDPTFFTERVINLWNTLPIDRVDFSSLPCFNKTHTSPFSHSLTPSYLIFAVCVFFVYCMLCSLSGV